MKQLKLTCECGDPDHVMTLTPEVQVGECFYIEVRAYSERNSFGERLWRAWNVLKGKDTALTEFILDPADFGEVAGFIAAQRPFSTTGGN